MWGKRYGGTVVVSSVGMFTTRAGWGIPISPASLMVTVDGGPAARFAERLAELIESGDGLQ